jgi:uncharacterized membrane protein YsdA (DUF1294 family)/cold shock CspA family protein
MRKKGRLCSWNDQKGFGFIEPGHGGKQLFIHICEFSNRNRKPKTGDVVTYTLSVDKQGRPCATGATLPGDTLPRRSKTNRKALSIAGAALFLSVIGILAFWSKLPPIIFGLYLAASLATVFMYALDKSAAKREGQRTPESTLHLLSFIGGWPGALIAQQTLRHKSRKKSFRKTFWMTVFLNLGVLAWLLTPEGLNIVQSWVGGGHTLILPGQRATIEWAEPR